MQDGFIKVAACSIDGAVADIPTNLEEIKARIVQADAAGVNLLVLPELCLTGASCGDLFFAQCLKDRVPAALADLRHYTEGKYPLVAVGAPLQYAGKWYNCAVLLHNGRILGAVPKTYLPDHGEFSERRQFESAQAVQDPSATVWIDGEAVPFGAGLLFRCAEQPLFCVGAEVGADLWAAIPPSTMLCRGGATVIAHLSADNEIVGRAARRRLLVESTSARLLCGYVSANAGLAESTQDVVCARHHMIAENGTILAENKPFGADSRIVSEVDVQRLSNERHRNSNYETHTIPNMRIISFSQMVKETELTRCFAQNPFIPEDVAVQNERAEEILQIQAHGLSKRLTHAHAAKAVIGISGGSDSTLAILVAARAMDMLGRSRKDILAITMPCFGTSKRTKNNAVQMCEALGVELREINIMASVKQHFADIGQSETEYDVTYENGQARERTQVLMDVANKCNGLVIGTGDLSELALGWATYNGDHMSMYGVNAGVPKTWVRRLVRYEAEGTENAQLRAVLLDVLDTPVSPELLPVNENGELSQVTENLVGPYELHDFFLYYMVRLGFTPTKIFRLAQHVFAGQYSDVVLLTWLRTFTRRFFIQQFKRSCMPDGPKVGTVTLSPRGDWRMPTDAVSRIWLDEIAELEKKYAAK